MRAEHDANAPRMPTRNPWLADSVYPISHFNPGATDSVEHAGPTHGRQLTADDVKFVLNIYTSNATVKTEDNETIVIAAGIDGIRKINATDDCAGVVDGDGATAGLDGKVFRRTPKSAYEAVLVIVYRRTGL